MVTRIHCTDAEQADEVAEALFAAGHEVAVVRERFAGEDDDEDPEHVVATTASAQQVRDRLDGMSAPTDEVFLIEQ